MARGGSSMIIPMVQCPVQKIWKYLLLNLVPKVPWGCYKYLVLFLQIRSSEKKNLQNVVVPTLAYMLALEQPHFFGRSVAPSVGIMVTVCDTYGLLILRTVYRTIKKSFKTLSMTHPKRTLNLAAPKYRNKAKPSYIFVIIFKKLYEGIHRDSWKS